MPGNIRLSALKKHYIVHKIFPYLKGKGFQKGMELSFTSSKFTENPYWITNKYSNNGHKRRLIGFLKLNYNITPWLSLIGRTGIDTYTFRRTPVVPWGTTYRKQGTLDVLENNVLQDNTDIMLKLKHALTSSIQLNATVGAHRSFFKMN